MRPGRGLAWVGLLAFVIVAAGVSVVVGPGKLIWHTGSQAVTLRPLRLALGLLAGGVLSLVGASLQGLLRNPLVDPFTLGVSGGAAFGVTALLALGMGSSLLQPVAGFAGALVTIVAVYLLARVRGRAGVTALVLAGVIVSFLFSGLVMLLVVLSHRPLAQAVWLLMGRLNTAFTRDSAWLFAGSAAVMLAGCGLLVSYSRDLDILSSSEETARSLGVNAARTTRAVFIVSSVLVGLVVAFTGAISFVGLVIPHIVRMLFGPRHRTVLPASFLLGAGMLVLADLGARLVVPGGLPLSIVTSLLGVPFFIYLLRTRL